MGREVWLTFFTDRARWAELASPGPEGGFPDDAEQTARAAELGVPADEFHPFPEDFKPRESPWTMTVPLVVLAIAATVGGVMNLPFPKSAHFLETWLEPVFEGGNATELTLSTAGILALLALSTVVALAGVAISWAIFQRRTVPLNGYEPQLLERAYRYDESIAAFVGGPGTVAFDAAADFDRVVVDGAVNGAGGAAKHTGFALRTIQDGFLRRYALALGAGSVLIIAFMVSRVVAG
jgi:NADH-quinone oxidoreductase subunit L